MNTTDTMFPACGGVVPSAITAAIVFDVWCGISLSLAGAAATICETRPRP